MGAPPLPRQFGADDAVDFIELAVYPLKRSAAQRQIRATVLADDVDHVRVVHLRGAFHDRLSCHRGQSFQNRDFGYNASATSRSVSGLLAALEACSTAWRAWMASSTLRAVR